MEKVIGIILGCGIALISLTAILILAGGAILDAITGLLALPIAAPLTTTLVILIIVVGFFLYRKKSADKTDDP